MTERAYRYSDQAKVYEMEESRTCKGCTREIKTVFGGNPPQVFLSCGQRRAYGKRCKHYSERTPDAK